MSTVAMGSLTASIPISYGRNRQDVRFSHAHSGTADNDSHDREPHSRGGRTARDESPSLDEVV